MMTRPPALLAENIHKSFGTLEVLKGLSLSATDGDVISMIGSSGSGKSTFLRCINFLEIPDQGRIIVDGEEVLMKADAWVGWAVPIPSKSAGSAPSSAWSFKASIFGPI